MDIPARSGPTSFEEFESETVTILRQPQFFTEASIWQDKPIPPRRWLVHQRIPMATPTLLSGDGATGKTTLALQLTVATRRGTDWLGAVIDEPGPAVFFTAEETEDEIHRRFAAIAHHHALEFRDLAGVHVFCRPGEDAVLGAPDQRGIVRATPLMNQLQVATLDLRPRLVVIESAADVFVGNENDRAQVRQFVTLLRRLAMAADAAVLLLAHPSLSGLASGSGTSGSTGWHNSVRSRLYFAAEKRDGEEGDPGVRVLSLKKSNYGPVGETVRVRWREGVFVMDSDLGAPQRAAAEAAIDDAFLRCLDARAAQGIGVSPFPSKTWAPAVFEKMPDAAGTKAKAFERAMERLLSSGRLRVETTGPASKQRSRLVRS